MDPGEGIRVSDLRDDLTGVFHPSRGLIPQLRYQPLRDGELRYVGAELATHPGASHHHDPGVHRAVEGERLAPAQQSIPREAAWAKRKSASFFHAGTGPRPDDTPIRMVSVSA